MTICGLAQTDPPPKNHRNLFKQTKPAFAVNGELQSAPQAGTFTVVPPIGVEGAPEINTIFSQEKWHSQTVSTPQP
jgi:hypothetical protein